MNRIKKIAVSMFAAGSVVLSTMGVMAPAQADIGDHLQCDTNLVWWTWRLIDNDTKLIQVTKYRKTCTVDGIFAYSYTWKVREAIR
jgi:hypothetical protein